MDSWWSRNVWRIVVLPSLSALLVGGVWFFYAYLHNRAGFDKDGRPLPQQPPDSPLVKAPPQPRLDTSGMLMLVVDDLTRAGTESASHFRYLSLAHRQDDPSVESPDLERDRQAISDLVGLLASPNTTAGVVALDRSRTVYRLDLRQLGWDDETWRKVTRNYPYGLKFDAATDLSLVELAQKLAQLTDARLPVVRGDWWVSALTKPPLTEPGEPGLTSKSPPSSVKESVRAHADRAVDLATAARELDVSIDEVKVVLNDAADLRDNFGLAPLLRPGGSISRDAWESNQNIVSPFQELAARLKKGKPILSR